MSQRLLTDLSINRSTGRSPLNTCIHIMKSIAEPGKRVVSNDLVKKIKVEDRGPWQTVPKSKRTHYRDRGV